MRKVVPTKIYPNGSKKLMHLSIRPQTHLDLRLEQLFVLSKIYENKVKLSIYTKKKSNDAAGLEPATICFAVANRSANSVMDKVKLFVSELKYL